MTNVMAGLQYGGVDAARLRLSLAPWSGIDGALSVLLLCSL